MKPNPWKQLGRILWPQRGKLLLGGALMLLQPFAMLPIARTVGRVFDHNLPARDFHAVINAGLLIAGLLALTQLLNLAGRALSTGAVTTAIEELRNELFALLYAFPRTYMDRQDKYRLHSVVMHETERLEVFAITVCTQTVPALVVAVVLGAVAFVLDRRLALLLLAALPVLFALGRLSQRKQRGAVVAFRREFNEAGRRVMLSLRHLDLTRHQTAESVEREQLADRFARVEEAGARAAFLQNAHTRQQQLALMLLSVVILVVGGYGVVHGDITIGHLLAFYAVAGMLSNYLKEMASSLNPVLTGLEALAQIHAYRTADSDPLYRGTKNVSLAGAIEFRRVSFGYENGPLVLSDVSLTLRPGLIIAIMGPNGGGKSTLMNLLLGLYRPRSGALAVDGLPYDEVELFQLRRAIGVVAQDPILFDGTIRQNITYGCSNPDDAALAHAATLAAAHAFICELPEGYDSQMGEGGVLLSGGQRQRIAIARAFFRKPKLLLLDEPTNHLDQAAVGQLIGNLRALPSRPTVLIVTHLRMIAAVADEVYELDRGELRPAAAKTATAGI